MGLRHGLTVGSLADIAIRRHDQLQELLDDDHTLYLRSRLTTTTEVQVVNSAVETDLLNVVLPAGILSAEAGLELFAEGDWSNDTLAAQTGTWRLHLTGEAAAVFTTGAISLAQSANARHWQLLWRFLTRASGFGVIGHARFAITDVTTGNIGVAEAAVRAGKPFDVTVDWAAAVTLRLTIQLGVANVALAVDRDVAYLQHLR